MTDQLSKAHLVSRTLKEAVYYPDHAPRAASPAYRAEHNHLVVELDLPCLVCGVRNSTLADPVHNPAGAEQMETHHRLVEWALISAVDLHKFNTRILAHMRVQHPGDTRLDHDFTQQEMEAFLDHDPAALWVLCDVHHRHALVGIHSVTYPVWSPQDLLRDDFTFTSEEAH